MLNEETLEERVKKLAIAVCDNISERRLNAKEYLFESEKYCYKLTLNEFEDDGGKYFRRVLNTEVSLLNSEDKIFFRIMHQLPPESGLMKDIEKQISYEVQNRYGKDEAFELQDSKEYVSRCLEYYFGHLEVVGTHFEQNPISLALDQFKL